MSKRLSSAPSYASDREDPFATPASSLRGSTKSMADNDAEPHGPSFSGPEEVQGEQRVADGQRESFYRDALHNIEERDRKSLTKADKKKAASSSQSSTQPATGQKSNSLWNGIVYSLAAANPATAAYSYRAPTTHPASTSAQAPAVSQMDWRPTTHLVLDERFEVKVTDSGDTEMRAVVDPPYIMTLHSSADGPGRLEVYWPDGDVVTFRSRKEGQGYIVQSIRGSLVRDTVFPLDPSSVLSRITAVTELQNNAFIFELGDPEEVFIINESNASIWFKKGDKKGDEREPPSYRAEPDLPNSLRYKSLKENKSIPWLEGHTFENESRPSTLSRVGKGISSLFPAHPLF